MSGGQRHRSHAWAIGGLCLAAIAVAMRANNALRYPHLFGFDAKENWRYIARLMHSWQLPAPDAGWATAHPPLFYYASAALARILDLDAEGSVIAVRLASSAFGLIVAALVFALVWQRTPERLRWAVLSAGFALFLPAHIFMSAMLSEEIAAGGLAACALAITAHVLRTSPGAWQGRAFAALAGLAAGLALLTKLSGLLVIAAAGVALVIDGCRRSQLRHGLERAAILTAIAVVVGGWYYGRNWLEYGYIYPQSLDTHAVMFLMPPGERDAGDYLRIPLSTFTNPNTLDDDLLHSVWGSTFITMWFDGHRKFLPTDSEMVRSIGSAILVLALLPCAAVLAGLWRGLRRIRQRDSGIDLLFTLAVAANLAGYAFFTWRNPWYATLKGSFLLGALLPCAYYAGETLDRWGRRRGLASAALWMALTLLVLLVVATFSWGLVFAKESFGGVNWMKLIAS